MWKVMVVDDFLADGIALHIGRRFGESHLVVIQPAPLVEVAVDRGAAAATSQEPALRINDEMGRALLDALAAHYGGAVDVRTTRQDLLEERKRTDRLIGALIDCTRPLLRENA